MNRFLTFVFLCLAGFGYSQDTYLGLYLQGNKLGYSSYRQSDDVYNGKPVKRNDSVTMINAGLLGTSMTMEMQSVSWSDSTGRPLRMKFVSKSSGRTQLVDATFTGNKVSVTINNNGAVSNKTLQVPAGGQIVDDPLTPIVTGGHAIGSKTVIYVLDPTTASLIRNEVVLRGPSKVSIKGKEVDATKVEILDQRANTTVYLSSKGDLIKAEGPMGIEMIPEPKEEAMGPGKPGYKPTIDLAVITSIKTDKPITDPANLGRLKIKISGKDLKAIPSDTVQTATGSGTNWVVTVHPAKLSAKPGSTIAQSKKSKPEWTKPALNIPSDSKTFLNLARQIVGAETNSKKAALKIQAYVQKTMHPNAGIGIVRDAAEVLKTKEGVCRDYAILTATLMRAAGIPAKLASGLVNWDGSFYYHAWVEVWDGSRWLGIDSTTPDPQISAAHVKLAEGNVEQAFNFTFLDQVKIEVMEAKRW